MNKEPLPPIDLLPLRLRGSHLISLEEYRVLRRLRETGHLVCLPKPKLFNKFFLMALSTAGDKWEPGERKSPLGSNWFIYSRIIFPRTTQFFVHVSSGSGLTKVITSDNQTWYITPELGFSGIESTHMLFSRSETRILRELMENPLATGREIAESLGMSYEYTRHVLTSLRKKSAHDYVFCVLRTAESLGGFVQLMALVEERGYRSSLRELGLTVRNSRIINLTRFVWNGRIWFVIFLIVNSNLADSLVKKVVKFPRAALSTDYVIRVKELSTVVPPSH